jgi:hypothetical protein
MSRLIFPKGFKRGLFKKDHKAGAISPLARDHIQKFSIEDIKKLIPQISLRRQILGMYGKYRISNQDGAGSCAGNSATYTLYTTLRLRMSFDIPLLNPWSLYGGRENGRKRGTSGGRDAGSSLGDNLRKLQDEKDGGVLPEVVHPQGGWVEGNPIQSRPSYDGLWKELPEGWRDVAKFFRVDEFWEATTILEVICSLLMEFGVVFGWQGHSCYLVEIAVTNQERFKKAKTLSELIASIAFVYANSWGNWGNKGFEIIRPREINFGYGCYAYRSVVSPRGWKKAAASVLGISPRELNKRLAALAI